MNTFYSQFWLNICALHDKNHDLAPARRAVKSGASGGEVVKKILKAKGIYTVLEIAEKSNLSRVVTHVTEAVSPEELLCCGDLRNFYRVILSNNDPGAAFKMMVYLGDEIEKRLLSSLCTVVKKEGGYFMICDLLDAHEDRVVTLSRHWYKMLRRKKKELWLQALAA